jgi:hypothetical protein
MLVASMTALVASGWSACRVGLILHPLESAAFPRRTPKPVIHAARLGMCAATRALRLGAWMLIGVKTCPSMDAKSGHGR